MASIRRRGDVWWLAVRLGGRQLQRSLKTDDEREARAIKAQVEQTVRDLERGRAELPADGDPWAYLLSDGKRSQPFSLVKSVTLSALWTAYFESQVGQKEPNTLRTEHIHRKHIEGEMGANLPLAAIDRAALTKYIGRRAAVVGPGTIRKEVATLRMLLNRSPELVKVKVPEVRELFAALPFPKQTEPEAFLTWPEVESRAKGLDDPAAVAALWDRVFLVTDEVTAFLDWAEGRRTRMPVPYMVPLLTAAAHTGARLAELRRRRVTDWADGVVELREKKRTRTGDTTRRVPVSPRLRRVVDAWLAGPHPGGPVMFTRLAGEPMADRALTNSWERFVRGSRWAVLRGYHVFRHSFASNLAAAGVDQRVIDELMGHQTEAMKKRYRHFTPGQRTDAVNRLFPK